jgi:hypothetical protein
MPQALGIPSTFKIIGLVSPGESLISLGNLGVSLIEKHIQIARIGVPR